MAESTFSGGNLGQLQEILFGQQQCSTPENIRTLQKQFVEQHNALSNMLNSRLNLLTKTVEKYHTNFEVQLNKSQSDNKSALKNINEKMNATKVELHANINTLSESTNKAVERHDTGLAKNKTKLLREVNDNKQELEVGINKSVNGLHSTKLDKQDLALLLSDLSGKLSDVATTQPK